MQPPLALFQHTFHEKANKTYCFFVLSGRRIVFFRRTECEAAYMKKWWFPANFRNCMKLSSKAV